MTVVLAIDADRVAYALAQVGTHAPEIVHDETTDDDYWLQVVPVDIACPAGHRWTWLDHTSLLDEHDAYIPFRDLFGHDPEAPYAECRDYRAYDNGERDALCPCDGRYTIYCPTCDQRCRLELTAVPTLGKGREAVSATTRRALTGQQLSGPPTWPHRRPCDAAPGRQP